MRSLCTRSLRGPAVVSFREIDNGSDGKTPEDSQKASSRKREATYCGGNNSFDIVLSLNHLGPSACAIIHTLLVSPNSSSKKKKTKNKTTIIHEDG